MTNLRNRLLILFAGMVTGMLIMLVVERHLDVPPAATSTAAIPKPTIELDDLAFADQPITDDAPADQQADLPSIESVEHSVAAPNTMPAVYRDMIGPVRQRSLSFAEVHALFEKEPRDEEWASVMESGINDHVARYGADRGLVVEYVECRSRYCEVGGYAIEGHEADFSMVWGDMTRTDWWQGGSTYQSQGGGRGEYQGRGVEAPNRFLAIIDRYDRNQH